MKSLNLLVVAIALAACVSLPTAEEAAAADYGSYPADHESIVKAFYARVLKDPESVRYQSVSSPQKYWLGNRFDGARYGYLVCVTLNAKNSYGGYTGYQTDGLLIRNGVVILTVDKGNWYGRQIC